MPDQQVFEKKRPLIGYERDDLYQFSNLGDPLFYWYKRPDISGLIERYNATENYGPWDLLKEMADFRGPLHYLAPRDKGPVSESRMPFHSQLGISKGMAMDRTWFPNRDAEYDVKYKQLQPFFRNAISDMSSVMFTTLNSKCSDLEIKAFDCIEYYGMKQGVKLCRDYFDDFKECQYAYLSNERVRLMERQQNKRWIDYMKGEREWSTFIKPPPKPHAFQEPYLNARWEN